MKAYDPTPEIELGIRSGFLSKKIWTEFLVDKKRAWKNQKWATFVKRGYFKPHHSARARDVLVPNPDNETVKRLAGDFICPAPSIAVLDHDEKVVQTFLKLRAAKILKFAKFEAELKKEDLRNKRHFDPSDASKFPDLLIELKGSEFEAKIAIEIELSRKEPKRYRHMMNSYMTKKDVGAIIVVSDLEVIRNGILTAIRDTYYPDWEKPIGFASLKQWLANPLKATIHFSEGPKSLESIGSKSINPQSVS
jgi:hypothetical protein